MRTYLLDWLKSPLGTTWLLGLLIVFFGGPAALGMPPSTDESAETSQTTFESPEEVAAKEMTAVRDGDFRTAALLVDPVALQELHASMVQVLDSVLELPRRDPRRRLLRQMLGAPPKKLRKLGPPELFAQLLQSTTGELSHLEKTLSKTEYEVLGHVLEEEDLSHVVARYRITVDDVTVNELTVVSLRLGQNGWGYLPRDVQALARSFREAFLGEVSKPAGVPAEAAEGPSKTAQDTSEPEPNSPELVAARSMTALMQGELETYVSFMDRAALEEFRTMMLPAVHAVDEMPEDDPRAYGLEIFFGSESTELGKLDSQALFLKFFQGSVANVPVITAMTYGSEFEVLGHLLEEEDIAHVIVRHRSPIFGVVQKKMTVVSLRRGEDGWGVLPRGNVVGIARALRQQVLD